MPGRRARTYDPGVSVPVGLEQLHEEIRRYGPHAHLVSVRDDGRPHVVSVLVEVDADGDAGSLVVGAGRTTSANAAANPTVTLLWAAPPGEDYSLIVDAVATVAGDRIAVRPTAAVRHRVATATGDGPSCVKVIQG